MSIISLPFLIFVFAIFAVYYLVPKKQQWVVLLVASIFFYALCGVQNACYILFTATTVYLATRWMYSISSDQKTYFKENKEVLTKEEKNIIKKKNQTKRRFIMIATLLFNLAILCVFKYSNFVIDQMNGVFQWFGNPASFSSVDFIVPLGISFYTFQSIGYLVDCYWEYYEPERNYFKVLLFVSFFPQITQGPISSFEQLSEQLFTEHKFDYQNYVYGLQRMLWGFLKKMIVASVLAGYVQDVFQNYAAYAGISVLIGAFMYSVQIYADFSGYMDIMCGFCQVLGIELTENFNRPYFAKSIAEYWRRWHISLGVWFKKYIYYPIGMSNWSRSFAKNTRERFGKHFSDTVPATIALLVTWLATGLWHGANWAYIAWGLVNGLFIILSLWLEPLYARTRRCLRIREDSFGWRAFQTVRTFVLVTFIKVLPEVGTLSQGFGLWKRIFTDFTIPSSLSALLPFVAFGQMYDLLSFLIAIACIGLMFAVSLIQRKRPVRQYINEKPYIVKTLLFAMLMMLVLIFGVSASCGEGVFLYENF